MAWSDAARAAALEARRRNHALKTYGTGHRKAAADALRRARKMTRSMGKHRNVVARRYAYQMITKSR